MMSSLNSTELPTTSSAALQKRLSKERECSLAESQSFDEIDKRLEVLLARVSSLETSLHKLSSTIPPYCSDDRGDTDEDLDALQNELDDEEHKFSDFVDDEEVDMKEDADDNQKLIEEMPEK
ncbi:uncharacterized protein LOC108087416 [Drosophila ficusphila]|uniref:uncharacterized protein LOC108087416 n=1 Tax=Drosophila ficusphila TaxID=30025 RepID=UPI0007E6C354|nr:uncharacterized protein LOC108087416 [Drosophila ficusphila]